MADVVRKAFFSCHGGTSREGSRVDRGRNDLADLVDHKAADSSRVLDAGAHASVDMANGPQQRVQPFPETIALLESLGAKINHNCLSCE